MTQLLIGPTSFSGEWDSANPTTFKHEDIQTAIDYHDVGKGIRTATRGLRLMIAGGRTQFYMHQSKPGLHAIYYAVVGTKILFDTFKLRLKQRNGGSTKGIEQMDSGPLYVFSKAGLKRYRVPTHPLPAIVDRTMDDAAREFLHLMIKAAGQMLEPFKDKPIVSLLTGGTDGALTTLALYEAGFDVRAVCVGTSEDDFDPKWARQYAKDWGISYELILIPSDEAELVQLLNRTVAKIEQADYSNVLMAMCSTLANDYAKHIGSEVVVHGHLADDVIGNEMWTVGEYRKRVAAGMPDTSENWSALRHESKLVMSPNTSQVDKVTRGDGLHWRTLWADPDVLDFVLSCPLKVCHAAKEKPLYQAALNPYLEDASWLHTHKVGYYTGSGIGELRKSRPYLSDQAMRDALRSQSN